MMKSVVSIMAYIRSLIDLPRQEIINIFSRQQLSAKVTGVKLEKSG